MDTALTVFTLVCAMLVFLMTPGLAFFYGGLSRKKNVGNTMIMSFLAIGLTVFIWMICGFSIAFGSQFSPEDGFLGQIIGGFDQLFLANTDTMAIDSSVEGLPDMVFAAFQGAFATITVGIITGSVAGRFKFGAIAAFLTAWIILVYTPLAHMVWGGGLIGGTIGALDFAGGDVVHISSGVTGLVLCILAGHRRGYGNYSYRAHNVPFVALGAGLLWFGWMGFNGGSALAVDDGVAGIALVNTLAASAAAMLSWMVTDKIATGHTTLVGAATGLVAGLVVITPAAGFVATWAALIMGIVVAPICYFAISWMKKKIGYDDALDAFGCHGVGGIVGGILTGLFCVPELSWTDHGGLFYTGDASLLLSQLLGIVITIVFVTIMTLIIGLIVKACFRGSLVVSPDDEAAGLDKAVHGETAYPAFDGLD
ncbi:MAG: ammonium transporter [Coriobacteriaceae bacterium]|nr:ammonium transporter [Coriobacteriaceae bacterium]